MGEHRELRVKVAREECRREQQRCIDDYHYDHGESKINLEMNE